MDISKTKPWASFVKFPHIEIIVSYIICDILNLHILNVLSANQPLLLVLINWLLPAQYCYTVCAPWSVMFNYEIGSSKLHETIRIGMVYVKSYEENQIGSIFSFNIDFSWWFLILDTLGCGRINCLLSEVFWQPNILKKYIYISIYLSIYLYKYQLI